MKKIISIVMFFIIATIAIFQSKVYAATLENIDITTDKQNVAPGSNIKVNVDFGQDLGAYTVDIAYDNNLLEYVSSEGGTVNDNGTRVRIYFYDQTGGTNPRSNMYVIFKAKDGIITSNPTDLSITAEGLANADASVTYDDITTPITKNIIVEPVYEDYKINLEYTGNVIKNEQKDMKISVASSLGKSYEHTRIVANATTSTGGTVKLFAIDSESLEHDIIQNGFGDASGDSIGGKNVNKVLDVKGLFSESGSYSITLSLINRDDSDNVIASKSFDITVAEKEVENENQENTNQNANNNSSVSNDETVNNVEKNNLTNVQQSTKPQALPKTGNTIYFVVISCGILLVIIYAVLRKKYNNK